MTSLQCYTLLKNLIGNQFMIQPQWGKVLQNAITQKKISWNQFFSNFFSKNVDFTEKMLIFRWESWSRFTALFLTVTTRLFAIFDLTEKLQIIKLCMYAWFQVCLSYFFITYLSKLFFFLVTFFVLLKKLEEKNVRR